MYYFIVGTSESFHSRSLIGFSKAPSVKDLIALFCDHPDFQIDGWNLQDMKEQIEIAHEIMDSWFTDYSEEFFKHNQAMCCGGAFYVNKVLLEWEFGRLAQWK